mmetsp:Transcript_35076/g.89640  ORF Transcript_35076/g.89640 Transcript_35076/m.89640 type:complete len:1015 (-) Transcript_35076:112-3156(-)|eukprot:CAMPEP_0174916938 /NCGR_PEP_ID=MMETSP1355-20121228/2149_1 /TAXON_ID=464990 /ORGANISM="Hemiselmis tepida, Strain CCMP443" /LENGTH=1014 /DNA_ID=CAMNT_0016161991 /DNA_START=222 /DNA_END=3266 /DNA_ORIENTATION=+
MSKSPIAASLATEDESQAGSGHFENSPGKLEGSPSRTKPGGVEATPPQTPSSPAGSPAPGEARTGSLGVSGRSLIKRERSSRAEMLRRQSLALLSKFLNTSKVNDNERLPLFVLHPHAGWRIVWDFSMFLLLMYSALAGPWRMSFQAISMGCGTPIFWVELSFDVLFCVDILLSCRTAFYTRHTSGDAKETKEHKFLETRTVPILWYYADFRNLWRGNGGGFLFLDVIGSFPVDAVLCGSEGSYDLMRVARAPRVLKALRLVRMLRLMKLARVSRILSKLKDRLKVNPGLLSLLVFLSAVMVSTHWLACLWFFAGTLMDDEPGLLTLSDPSTASWSAQYKIVSEGYNQSLSIYCVTYDGKKLDPNCKEASSGEQYVASLYWAIASLCTVGYGDVKAYNVPEISISIVTMIAGGFCFAYMVGGLTVMLERLSVKNKNLRDTLYEMGGFMHRERVPPNIQSAIRRYFTRRANNKRTIPVMLSRLSGSLKKEVYLLLYKDLVQSVPFFRTFSDKALVFLISKFQYASASAGEVIYWEDQSGDTVYFLRGGQVEMSMSMGAKEKNQAPATWMIKEKGFFGENIVVNKRWRLATARAVTWCNMFTLTKSDIDETAKLYPDAGKALERYGNKVIGKWRWSVRQVTQQIRLANKQSSCESSTAPDSRSRSTNSDGTYSAVSSRFGGASGFKTVWKGLTSAPANLSRQFLGGGSSTPGSSREKASHSVESSRGEGAHSREISGEKGSKEEQLVTAGNFGHDQQGEEEQSDSDPRRTPAPLPAETRGMDSPHAASSPEGSQAKSPIGKLKALPSTRAHASAPENERRPGRGSGLSGLEALPPIQTPPPLPGAAEAVAFPGDGLVTMSSAGKGGGTDSGSLNSSGVVRTANITSGGTRGNPLIVQDGTKPAPTLAPTDSKPVKKNRPMLRPEKTEEQKMLEMRVEWETRCDVQDILLQQIEYLKQHTIKLKQMTSQYASEVETQQQHIRDLQNEVMAKDSSWGTTNWAGGTAADFMPEQSADGR